MSSFSPDEGQTLADGTVTFDPRLDRLVKFDERSRQYPIRQLVAGKRRRGYSWSHVPNLDQGREGACTGFSVAMEAAARPVKVRDITNDVARSIYYRARQIDEWEGEAYEGSSVLAAVKVGQEHGWYEEYRWAFSEEDLALAVGYRGPAILGTWWHRDMFRPAQDGYLRPTGGKVGGHAYIVSKYSMKKEAYWVPNSWGGAGAGWLHREDAAMLLADQGEACIPVKRKKAA